MIVGGYLQALIVDLGSIILGNQEIGLKQQVYNKFIKRLDRL